ncbi:hypothetical protein MRX96_022734 [Rhipicephalus microplus]
MIVSSALYTASGGATPWLTRTSLGERSGGLPRGKVAVLLPRSCCEAASEWAVLASVLLIQLASPKGSSRCTAAKLV